MSRLNLQDELLWAAAWLYEATNNQYYLNYLGENGDSMGGTGWSMTEFGWDVKYAGVQTLVAKVCSFNFKDFPTIVWIVLGIMTLHNRMILSTLNRSSRGFTFDFIKRPRTNGDSILNKPMVSLISRCGTPLPTIFNNLPRTKYTIEPLLRSMEPSNSLSLIEAQLIL